MTATLTSSDGIPVVDAVNVIDSWVWPKFPAKFLFTFVAFWEADLTDAGVEMAVRLQLTDDQGSELGHMEPDVEVPFPASANVPAMGALIMPSGGVRLPRPGTYHFRLFVLGEHSHTSTFRAHASSAGGDSAQGRPE